MKVLKACIPVALVNVIHFRARWIKQQRIVLERPPVSLSDEGQSRYQGPSLVQVILDFEIQCVSVDFADINFADTAFETIDTNELVIQ